MTLMHVLFYLVAASQVTAPTSSATMKATSNDFGSILDAIFEPPPGSIEVAPGIAVVAQWGIWDDDRIKRPGKPQVAGKELTLDDDRLYGMSIFFFQTRDCQGGDITYREVFTLPAKPQRWGLNGYQEFPKIARPKADISADGRVHTFEQKFHLKPRQVIPTIETPNNIYIMSPYPLHRWNVAPGDPPGDWTIEAFVNDKPVAKTTFVVKPAKKK